MKRILLLSLLSLIMGVNAIAAKPKAKWERRLERAEEQDRWELDRIWKRRSGYLNLSYVTQNTKTNIDELSSMNSGRAKSLSIVFSLFFPPCFDFLYWLTDLSF